MVVVVVEAGVTGAGFGLGGTARLAAAGLGVLHRINNDINQPHSYHHQ